MIRVDMLKTMKLLKLYLIPFANDKGRISEISEKRYYNYKAPHMSILRAAILLPIALVGLLMSMSIISVYAQSENNNTFVTPDNLEIQDSINTLPPASKNMTDNAAQSNETRGANISINSLDEINAALTKGLDAIDEARHMITLVRDKFYGQFTPTLSARLWVFVFDTNEKGIPIGPHETTGGGLPLERFPGEITVHALHVDPKTFIGTISGTEVKLAPGSYEVTQKPGTSGVKTFYGKDCSGMIKAGMTKTCQIHNVGSLIG
jgi:hypothetical protein